MDRAPVDRRTVLRAAGAGAAAAVTPLALGEPARAAAAWFRHGVASGDPQPDRVVLWTRVTPGDQAVPGSGIGPDVAVSWPLATDPGFAGSGPLITGTVVTGAARDHTVKVDAGGLRPDTAYWYRFGVEGNWSPAGRTRTAPPADADLARLRFGVVSCANWEAGYFAAYRHLAGRGDLDAVLHLGDYLYEYRTGRYAAAGKVVRPHQPGHEAITLADYRIRHGQYKTDPDLQALHAELPWICTWDDHEVANDAWSGGAENHDPATEGSYAARLAASHQAYREWMPVRFGADGTIYRRLRYGTLAEIAMLDLRTYRSAPDRTAVDDPGRTITGQAQLAWLEGGLAACEATWKLIGNPVMISRLDAATLPAWLLGPLRSLLGIPENGFAYSVDDWDGYNADRDRLVAFLKDRQIDDVVFLTGDIHSSWANELTTRTTLDSPAAVEFIVPSITSDNVNDLLHVPEGTVSRLADTVIRATNPHVKWTDLDRHGYGVLEVTPARCRMDWYFLADRTKATSGIRWGRAFSVRAGTARLAAEPSR